MVEGKCATCGRVYPSRFYFSEPGLCLECAGAAPRADAPRREKPRQAPMELVRAWLAPISTLWIVLGALVAAFGVLGGFIVFSIGLGLGVDGETAGFLFLWWLWSALQGLIYGALVASIGLLIKVVLVLEERTRPVPDQKTKAKTGKKA